LREANNKIKALKEENRELKRTPTQSLPLGYLIVGVLEGGTRSEKAKMDKIKIKIKIKNPSRHITILVITSWCISGVQ
jgi:hypothetical protein